MEGRLEARKERKEGHYVCSRNCRRVSTTSYYVPFEPHSVILPTQVKAATVPTIASWHRTHIPPVHGNPVRAYHRHSQIGMALPHVGVEDIKIIRATITIFAQKSACALRSSC
jgi:hypothetical protein